MKLKYYLRGMGIGMILTAIIMGIALHGRTETLSDAEIMARARELGMIDSTTLSDYAAQGSSGDAMGGGGENGNAADGSAQASVKSVSQMGESGSPRVVFEKLKPEDDATIGSARDTTGGAAGKNSPGSAGNSGTSSSASAGKTASGAASSKSAVVMRSEATAFSSGSTGAAGDVDRADTASSASVTNASTGNTAAMKPSETAVAAAAASTVATKPAETSAASGSASTVSVKPAETAVAAVAASTSETKPAETSAASDTASTSAASPAPAQTDVPAAQSRTVTIPGGVGSETVARILEQAGIISSASDFDAYLCDRRVDRILRSGTKTIPEGADFEEIAGILTR